MDKFVKPVTVNRLCLFFIVIFFSQYSLANTILPDPTKPADYFSNNEPVIANQPGEKINWVVSAIKISSSDRSAIVNGRLVRVGDKVNFGVIEEINSVSVLVKHENRKLIVNLFKDFVRKEYKK